jgi:hypothetical protein
VARVTQDYASTILHNDSAARKRSLQELATGLPGPAQKNFLGFS